jgi:hypothetical protein
MNIYLESTSNSSTYNNLHLLQSKNLRYKSDRRLGRLNSQQEQSDNEKIFLPLLRFFRMLTALNISSTAAHSMHFLLNLLYAPYRTHTNFILLQNETSRQE